MLWPAAGWLLAAGSRSVWLICPVLAVWLQHMFPEQTLVELDFFFVPVTSTEVGTIFPRSLRVGTTAVAPALIAADLSMTEPPIIQCGSLKSLC